MFVACGHQGQRAVSEDGITWKNHVLGKEGEVYRAAAKGDGHLVCVGTLGGKNIMLTSVDGTNWTPSTNDAKYSNYMQGIAHGDGKFLAVGGDAGTVGSAKPFVMTTTDGAKWSNFISISGRYILRRIAFGSGIWVGVGDRGRRASSKDGLTWEDVEKVKAIDTLVDVAYGNGTFVGVGLHSLRMTTKDGKSWENRQTGLEGEHLNSIVWADSRFVAIGQGATYFSPDGISWERKENQNAPLAATYGAGQFVGVHWKGRLLHSTDAVVWKEVFKSEHHFEAVA